jgi:hypothetical protein
MRSLAYLDAMSGSMVVQAVVAGVAGIAVCFKLFWRRLTAPFRSRRTVRVEMAESDER